jgi:hypothetical protein
MTTWTSGKAGWAVMDAEGRFLTQPDAIGVLRGCWEPEGARLFRSRDAARKAAAAMGHGLKVVQLVSPEQWDRQYGPQSVPMAAVAAVEKSKRRARDARRRGQVA